MVSFFLALVLRTAECIIKYFHVGVVFDFRCYACHVLVIIYIRLQCIILQIQNLSLRLPLLKPYHIKI